MISIFIQIYANFDKKAILNFNKKKIITPNILCLIHTQCPYSFMTLGERIQKIKFYNSKEPY